MFQEQRSEEKESEVKVCEEEKMSEKVTGEICWYLESATAPLIALSKTSVQVSVPSSLTHKSKQFPKPDKHSKLHLGTHPTQEDTFLSF